MYLFAGGGQFSRLGCQVGQILQDGLQVGHLAQHVDLVVLQEVETSVSFTCFFTFNSCSRSLARATDQDGLQHADEAAVTRPLLDQRSAHGPLLRFLQDGVAHVDVLQGAVQLAASLVLPWRRTHGRERLMR